MTKQKKHTDNTASVSDNIINRLALDLCEPTALYGLYTHTHTGVRHFLFLDARVFKNCPSMFSFMFAGGGRAIIITSTVLKIYVYKYHAYRICRTPRLLRWDNRDRYRSNSVEGCRRTSCRTGNSRCRKVHLFCFFFVL